MSPAVEMANQRLINIVNDFSPVSHKLCFEGIRALFQPLSGMYSSLSTTFDLFLFPIESFHIVRSFQNVSFRNTFQAYKFNMIFLSILISHATPCGIANVTKPTWRRIWSWISFITYITGKPRIITNPRIIINQQFITIKRRNYHLMAPFTGWYSIAHFDWL